MYISSILDESVSKIRHKQIGHRAQNPLSAGTEILLEAVMIRHLFREQPHAQIGNHRVRGDKEIERSTVESPAIFPPPEMNEVEKNEKGPQQVHPIHLVFLGMLYDARYSTRSSRETPKPRIIVNNTRACI